jgi:Uma2 family endonuclease
MINAGIDYLTLIEALPPGAVLTLNNVAWEEYDALLHELIEQTHLRLTYDQGTLEIMTLSPEHERISDFFPHLILVLAQACRLNFIGCRSTTFRKQQKAKGTEPDDCYYFRDFKRIAGKKTIDLSVDPPPDLVFEVDISHQSISKFPIYASIGVPELWRYAGEKMRFYRLAGEDYVEITRSDLFPFLTPETLRTFLQRGEAEGTVVMVNEFSKWVRKHKAARARKGKRQK